MTNKIFFAALEDLEKEKGIPKEIFIEALENALISACKKQYSESIGTVEIKMNPDKDAIEFYTVKTVVEAVEDEDNEITLEDAQKIKKSYKLGDKVMEKLVPKDFSRIAAQTAKQVILQKLHETERDRAMNEFADKEGELIVGVVRKIDAKNVYVEIGKGQVEGLMMPGDQVPGEKYAVNDRIKVFVKRVKSGYRSAQVLVSRSAPGLVKKLFEEEVPEIKQGTVVIKEISREAGARTKIAIYSEDERVDAIGACVGNKGARVNAIVEELKGEKIDIIPWSENPLEFIAKSLSPAKVISVTQLEGEKMAMAVVPDDKLSLAIGKDGQNARLAVRLTGWKIDVKSQSAAAKLGLTVEEVQEDAEINQ
ncbi:MAG: transcription termination/antitermination protein NusA [Clostridia bacterium]|jgi:N utilization substance protein A|nr:transcription termination/antitermination protein NusA [Clostridia bacterium]